MDFHSGNSLPTSYPSFPYSWKLTGVQRAERVHFISNLPVHLAHIHPPSSSADGEKGGLAGQRETEWPSVIGHTWLWGNWKEVSLREQLHTAASSGEKCASKQSCWALTTEHLAYDEAGDYLNHQIY